MKHIDDNFLYELRSPPPPDFASRLKAKLDRQANEAQKKRRAFKWFVFGAILMGGTALAFISPSMRQATVALLMSFRGSSVSQSATEPLHRVSTQTASVRSDRLSELDLIPTETETVPGSAVARDGDANRVDASVSAHSATIVPASANADRSSGRTGEPSRRIVRIGHSAALASLAEGIAVELESRRSDVSIETSEVPENTQMCSWQFKSSDIDIVLTERRASQTSGRECRGGTTYGESPFAYDAIVIVVNRENTWARSISPADLRRLHEDLPAGPMLTPSPEAVTTWNQIRSQWPTLPFTLFGTALQRSGLGLHFAELIGMDRNPTALQVTKNDRATLSSVESSLGAMGYINFSTLTTALSDQYASTAAAAITNAKGNKTLTTALSDRYAWTIAAITNAKGEAVEPTAAAIQEGRYPLSRTIWLYANTNVGRRIQMQQVIGGLFHSQPPQAIADHGLIPVGRTDREAAIRRLTD